MSAGSRASHPVIPGWEARCRHVLDLVFIERTRQVAQYGHNEDLEDGMGPDVCWLLPFTTANAEQAERALRRDYEDFEEQTGKPTWAHLIREELAETFAEADPVAREEEALQVAALLVSYVENSRRLRLADQQPPVPYEDESNGRMAPCGRSFNHQPHGGPTATRDASCDGRVRDAAPVPPG